MAPISAEQTLEYHRQHLATLRRLCMANDDLGDRFRTSEISAVFDIEDDVLAITFDTQQEALTIDIDEGVYFRVDPDTYKLVGIEVWHPRECLTAGSPIGRVVTKALAASRERVTIVRLVDPGTTSLAEDMSELISA